MVLGINQFIGRDGGTHREGSARGIIGSSMLPARKLGTNLPACPKIHLREGRIGSCLPEIDTGEADWHFAEPAVFMSELLDGGHRIDAEGGGR